MLFQILSSVLPFRGDSMAELMYKIASEVAVDIRTIRKKLPASLASIVALSLSKCPETRYQSGDQSGDQFAADLKEVLAAPGENGSISFSQPMKVQPVHAPEKPGHLDKPQLQPPPGAFKPFARVTSTDIEI